MQDWQDYELTINNSYSRSGSSMDWSVVSVSRFVTESSEGIVFTCGKCGNAIEGDVIVCESCGRVPLTGWTVIEGDKK